MTRDTISIQIPQVDFARLVSRSCPVGLVIVAGGGGGGGGGAECLVQFSTKLSNRQCFQRYNNIRNRIQNTEISLSMNNIEI